MDVIHIHHPHRYERSSFPPQVIALGFFDGVHNGHQAVIEKAVSIAKEKNIEVAVMTFYPHPKEVLRKENENMTYLTPLNKKIAEIRKLGVDRIFVVEFTQMFADLNPQQFADDYFIALHAEHVVAGFDFTYGHLGKGTMETLPFHSREMFTQTTVGKVNNHGEKISSTRIRGLLSNGDVEQACHLLGRPYSIEGEVVDGEKRGRTIGFPTANVSLTDRFQTPHTGVYAVQMAVEGALYNGVCNVGYKPTFNNEKINVPTIEVHLFDFHGDLYGKTVEVFWHSRLRGEVAFSSVNELIEQINKDKQRGIEFFSR
ncbi:bifunctional riboflavin kinase/FAD synthetase [Texcoconibacillus texcoconensis]|uniref:Riboflavin biosynthesis protein n=1 Tax=Texcoconibacillus texcoconensis TaxID=1095777 RepID=A0A840QCI5_9BACI|nr:bifunctional riboflavin kinase/FAD synthetase [Texcoconibacillus texcoconensis]MBB5172030.1 riboflavin kinase/FMN adenylyltransferase [Texcoconibacillus texcoconensis]